MSLTKASTNLRHPPQSTTSSFDTTIVEGNFHECYLALYRNINDFYVNLTSNWDSLEGQQSKLQRACPLNGTTLEEIKITPIVGLEVAVAAPNSIPTVVNSERHRAKLLRKVEDKPGFWKARFIDYGEVVEVPEDKMQPLPVQFTKYPAQAIHCRLLFPPLEGMSLKVANKYFERETKDKSLGVHFFGYSKVRDIWKVNVGVQPVGTPFPRHAFSKDNQLVDMGKGIYQELEKFKNN